MGSNYTKVLNYKSKVEIPYLGLEFNSKTTLLIIILVSIILTLPFILINKFFAFIIFMVIFITLTNVLQDYNSDEDNYTALITFLQITNRTYKLNTKHFKSGRYINYKSSRYKIQNLIDISEYR